MSDKRNWRESTQGERLRWALQHSPKALQSPGGKVKQNELARAINIRPSSLNQALSGLTNSMTAANTAAAARYLKISYYWLAEGRGQPEDTGITRIPVTGRISRKDNIMAIETVMDGGYIRFYSDDPDAEFYIIDDNSFAPVIPAGRVALVEPNHEIKPGMPLLLRLLNAPPDIAEYHYDTAQHRIYKSYRSDAAGELRIKREDIARESYIKAILSELEILT